MAFGRCLSVVVFSLGKPVRATLLAGLDVVLRLPLGTIGHLDLIFPPSFLSSFAAAYGAPPHVDLQAVGLLQESHFWWPAMALSKGQQIA